MDIAGVQTTMNWANMGSIQETYGSYLSVASALYCMVPMLTLFLLTTSIHPMMGALKNVTPDAPNNTGHVTPDVWSAGMRVNSPLVTRHTPQPLQPVPVCQQAGF